MSVWQEIQTNLFMAQLESTLFHDLIPEVLQNVHLPSGSIHFNSVMTAKDELAYKLRTVRSVLLSGKANRCATIGQYQDAD